MKDKFYLDTTGEYLQIGKHKKRRKSPEAIARQEEADRLFYENVPLFLANSETILSDSRMFFAPVGVKNALAYTGTNGLSNPTLGIYLEWWRNFKEESFDKEGHPIWYITGSPLSGSHACKSVDKSGISHPASLNVHFSDVWQSFMSVNSLYREAKTRYEAYTLAETIERLTNQ